MSFATILNAYCESLGCTNQMIADQCHVSASALSRYRVGKRVPDPGSQTIENLSAGIAALSVNGPSGIPMRPENIKAALTASLTGSHMVGMTFNMRLDKLMGLLDIRNVQIADVTGVDPSYVSRIRKGQRSPANLQEFAELCARKAASLCFEQDALASLAQLVSTAEGVPERFDPNLDSESDLAELIEQWLLGDQVVNSDLAKLEALFLWLDRTDLWEWTTIAKESPDSVDACPARLARFYSGIAGMRDAELDFFAISYEMRISELSLSSDMPLLQMNVTDDFLAKYKRGITALLRAGCHVNIIHNVERPLGETVRSLRMWIPLYLTGGVTPYYLKGVNNRLFCHTNYVSDVCALSAEAVMGHQEDGRYYLTTRPEDIQYYQRKMQFILERSSSMLELYREDDPEQREAFNRSEAVRRAKGNGRAIGEGKYRNLRLTLYPGECVTITFPCGPTTVHFVVRHPKIWFAVSQMQ